MCVCVTLRVCTDDTHIAAQISDSMMIYWCKNANRIHAAVRAARSGSRLLAKRVGAFNDAEVATAIDVRAARAQGRKVTARFIRASMRRHVAAKYDAAKAATFKASASWLAAFVSRFAFSWRRATNRKSKTVADRLPAVRLYFARLARRLARHVRPPVIVGSMMPSSTLSLPIAPYTMGISQQCRLNVDQVPFEFESDARYTYADKGSNAVHVAGAHGQHKDSRFGTFQVLINLSGVKQLQPQLVVVFRGKGLKIKIGRASCRERVFKDV